MAAPSRGSLWAYPHEVMRGHGVRYPADFVVGLEDVIVDLEFLSAVVPRRQGQGQRLWVAVDSIIS